MSYSSVICASLSLSILSQIRVTCFRVNSGCSLRGGDDPGEYDENEPISGELGQGTLRCLRLWSLFHSWCMLAETWSEIKTTFQRQMLMTTENNWILMWWKPQNKLSLINYCTITYKKQMFPHWALIWQCPRACSLNKDSLFQDGECLL